MKILKKLLSMMLTLCVFFNAMPAIAVANADTTAKKTAMSETALAATLGGQGSLDATITSDYRTGSPVSAVVANRDSLLYSTYSMESLDVAGNNVITIATGELAPGEGKVITATPPVDRDSSNWLVRVRLANSGVPGFATEDVVTYRKTATP